MLQQCQNIYQISRENARLTQEKASELLGISVEVLELMKMIKESQIIQ